MSYSTRILLTAGALISLATGCSEPPTQPEHVPNPPPATPAAPVVPGNTAPRVYARPNVWVPLPVNFLLLEAHATDAESNIQSYSWTKISGPASYLIENPKSPRTQVTNLEQGTYEFELIVTDKGGLTGKATIAVSVYDARIPGKNELIFKYLGWSCPMGCSLAIENFEHIVPKGTAIKVFVKEAGSAVWVEATPIAQWQQYERYVYEISDNGTFLIYADYPDDEGGTVEVKITF